MDRIVSTSAAAPRSYSLSYDADRPQQASTPLIQNQRLDGEPPLNRNPRANASFASKLRNGIANHSKVRGTDGRLVTPVIVTERMLEQLIGRWKSPVGKGHFVEGIPGTSPRYDVRSLTLLDLKTGKCFTSGTRDTTNGRLVKFSQQSMSKSVAEALAIKLLAENPEITDPVKAFSKMVGFDASDQPYNAHATYPDRPGVPFNSSVNIGALKTWDIIITQARRLREDPFKLYLQFEKALAGNETLAFNAEMAEGEFNFTPGVGQESNNMRMLAELENLGALANPREEVYRAYCQACAIMVNTEDAARVRAGLRTGKHAGTSDCFMPPEMADLLNRSTAVHGLYNESGRIYVNTGASVKSGVDGGLMGSLPSKILGNPDVIFASHHAALNPKGNSLEGERWLKELSRMPLIFADDEKLSKPSTLLKGIARKVLNKSSRIDAGSTQSPEAVDRELRANMKDGGVQRLEAALARRLEGAYQGEVKFYLKEYKSAKPLNKSGLLFGEIDRNGVGKGYYHVPDTHHIEKVVVREARIFEFEEVTPITWPPR